MMAQTTKALRKQSQKPRVQARLDAAYRAGCQALRLLRRSTTTSPLKLANALNNLAEIEQQRQNFEEALALADEARSIDGHPAKGELGKACAHDVGGSIRVRTLALAGSILCTQGKYAEAEKDLKQVLALAKAEWGNWSEEAAEARNNLGVLYKFWGRFDEGLKLYQQALKALAAIGGKDSLSCARIYHNIGGILHAQGNCAQAERPARKAWEISRQWLGEGDEQTMLDATAYAAVLDGLKRYDESEPIYRRALAIFERVYGPNHYEAAVLLHNLAAVLVERNRYQEAEKHYRRALAIQENLLGLDSPDVALTRNNLGKLLTRLGRPGEAVPLLKAALSVLQERLATGHPHLTKVRKNLRDATWEQKSFRVKN